jgi:hypothetical protein
MHRNVFRIKLGTETIEFINQNNEKEIFAGYTHCERESRGEKP